MEFRDDSTTTNEERKRILSTAVTKIVLYDINPAAFEIEIHWAGGLVERHPLLRGPVGPQLATRMETLQCIGQMLTDSRPQPEILQALESQVAAPDERRRPDGNLEWTPARLRAVIKRLRLGVWGQAVPPIHPSTRSVRKLEAAAIQVLADRRKARMSFRQIAGELNGLRYRTPLGRVFTEANVSALYRGLQQDPTLADVFAFDDPHGSRGKTFSRHRAAEDATGPEHGLSQDG